MTPPNKSGGASAAGTDAPDDTVHSAPRRRFPIKREGTDVLPSPARPSQRRRWRRRWTVWLVLVAAALSALTFVAAANYVIVDLRLIGWRGDVRLSWALLVTSGLGFLLGYGASRFGR